MQSASHFDPCPTCKGTGDGPPCAGQHGCDHGLGVCNAPACRSCEGQGEVNYAFDPEPRWWTREWWRERITIQRRFCVVFGWRLW